MSWKLTGIVLALVVGCGAGTGWGDDTAAAEEATRISTQAAQLYQEGHYAEAARLQEQLVQIRERTLGPYHPETARALHDLVASYLGAAEYGKALPLAHRALIIREKALGPEHADTAQSQHDVAEVYGRMGEYAKALPLAQRALDIREKTLGKEHRDTAQSRNDLGVLYMEMRNYQEAVHQYERALAIREKALGPDHPLTAESLGNLAAAYVCLKEYQQALPLFERALTIKEKTLGPEHPETANTLANFAELRRAMHDDAKAVPLLQRVAEIKEKTLGPEHPETAKALNNLAGFYWSAGDYGRQQALPLLQRVEAIWEKTLGPDHPYTVGAINRLAAFYQSTGDYAQALSLYRRGLAAEDLTLARIFEVPSEHEKLQFVDRTQGHYWAALSLIRRHFANDPSAVRFGLDLVLRRKSIVLDAQSRTQEALAGHLNGNVLQAWQRLTKYRDDYIKLVVAGPGEEGTEAYREKIDALRQSIDREEQFLSQHSPLVARELAQGQVTAEMLAARLPADGALVEFVVLGNWDEKGLAWTGTPHYLAFTLTSDNRVTLVDLGEMEATDDKIDSTLSAINDPDFIKDVSSHTHRTDAELSELYARILQPLETSIGNSGPLIVSPDGQLYRVPFAALRTARGQYLVEQRPVSHVTSGRDLVRGKSDIPPTVNLVLAANPAFGDRGALRGSASRSRPAIRAAYYEGDYRPLPGTAEEARAIVPLVKGTKKVLLGRDATESAIRATKSPQILHLATHGFFELEAEDPMFPDPLGRSGGAPFRSGSEDLLLRSGLALAGANYANEIAKGDDGILTALEVSEMDLYGTHLVVLSACDTALGFEPTHVQSGREFKHTGESVFGLRRAFVLAGARNLVMSLWEVNDKFTRDLMEGFYEEYESSGSAALALHNAELKTIAKLRAATKASKQGEELAPVNLWAPFIAQQTGE